MLIAKSWRGGGKGELKKITALTVLLSGEGVGIKQRGWVREEWGTEGGPGKERKWAIH